MSFAQDLRASVLQAAMQGKLTEQLETDTPVSKLLADISTKTKKKITLLEDDGLPIDWGSVKITDVVTLYTGNSISESVKTAKYCGLKEGYDYIGTKDVNFDHTICYNNGVKIPFNEPNFRYAEKGATLLCIEGGSAGRKIAILDKKVCFGNKLCAFHPIDIESKFLYFFLQSPQFLGVFANNISGIIGGVSINKIKQMTLPVPPIEEQKRIVRRIEEIMIIINELEAIEEELKKLKEVFPADMKAAVLQAAMQGKLTEQLETDSSVDDLLEDIKKEREKLVAKGKMKKSRTKQNDNFVAFSDDEVPFEIPDNWRWVYLGDLFNIERGGSPRPIQEFITTSEDGVNWIKIGDSDIGGKYIYSTKEKIIKAGISKSRYVEKDSFLLTNSMSYGRPYILKTDGCIHDGWLVLKPYNRTISQDFLYVVLSSPFVFNQFSGKANGAVVKNLNIDKVVETYIALPPLEEQNRIVAKLEQVLPLLSDLS